MHHTICRKGSTIKKYFKPFKSIKNVNPLFFIYTLKTRLRNSYILIFFNVISCLKCYKILTRIFFYLYNFDIFVYPYRVHIICCIVFIFNRVLVFFVSCSCLLSYFKYFLVLYLYHIIVSYLFKTVID